MHTSIFFNYSFIEICCWIFFPPMKVYKVDIMCSTPFLCQACHITLLFQVKTKNPPLLICLLIYHFLYSVSIKPMTAKLVILRGVCVRVGGYVCVCVCVRRVCISKWMCLSAFISALGCHEMGRHKLPMIIIITTYDVVWALKANYFLTYLSKTHITETKGSEDNSTWVRHRFQKQKKQKKNVPEWNKDYRHRRSRRQLYLNKTQQKKVEDNCTWVI